MKNKVFGQISVIAFEQCPTLRSNLTKRRQPSRKVKKKHLSLGFYWIFNYAAAYPIKDPHVSYSKQKV